MRRKIVERKIKKKLFVLRNKRKLRKQKRNNVIFTNNLKKKISIFLILSLFISLVIITYSENKKVKLNSLSLISNITKELKKEIELKRNVTKEIVKNNKVQCSNKNNIERKKKLELKYKEIPIKESRIYYTVNDYENGYNYKSKLDENLQDYLREKCKEYGIIEYFPIIIAQYYHESHYNPNCISDTNDYGLAQINEQNFERLRKELGITDFLDPYQSIDCGVYIYKECLEKVDYRGEKALVVYNMGTTKYDSSKYSREIIKIYENLTYEVKEVETGKTEKIAITKITE